MLLLADQVCLLVLSLLMMTTLIYHHCASDPVEDITKLLEMFPNMDENPNKVFSGGLRQAPNVLFAIRKYAKVSL